MNSLQYTLSEEHVDYSKCYEICHSALNNHVPRKKKYIRRNNNSFVTKPYLRAIITKNMFYKQIFRKWY